MTVRNENQVYSDTYFMIQNHTNVQLANMLCDRNNDHWKLLADNARLRALLDGVTCAVCGRAMVEHEQRCEEER